MATYTVQSVVETGLNPTYVAVGSTDTFTPAAGSEGHTFILHVKNTGGSPDVVEVDDPNSVSPVGAQAFDADLSVSVPATTGDRLIRVPGTRFRNAGTGVITVTHTFLTSVTAAVFDIG